MADYCNECGESRKWGYLRPQDHKNGCPWYHKMEAGPPGVAKKPKSSVPLHRHNYQPTGRSRKKREKRGTRWYALTWYERKCDVDGCKKPVTWEGPFEVRE